MGKGNAGKRLKRKEYEEKLETLHIELVHLQEWVKLKGLKWRLSSVWALSPTSSPNRCWSASRPASAS